MHDTDTSLWSQIKRHMLYFLSAIGLVSLFVVVGAFLWLRQALQPDGSQQGGLLGRGKIAAKMFLPSQIKTKFSDVAGSIEAKQELVDIIDYLRDPKKFQKVGANVPRG